LSEPSLCHRSLAARFPPTKQENTLELHDQIKSIRRDLDTAQPFDPEPFEAALKISMNGIGPRKTNECFLDFVPFPQLFGMGQLGFLLDQQNQRELEHSP